MSQENKKLYSRSEALILKADTLKLNDFTGLINTNERTEIVGIVIREHNDTATDYDQIPLVPSNVLDSGYITINDFSTNVIQNLSLSVIVQMTKEHGYYPLGMAGRVDFNQSKIIFGNTTNGLNKSVVIGFMFKQ